MPGLYVLVSWHFYSTVITKNQKEVQPSKEKHSQVWETQWQLPKALHINIKSLTWLSGAWDVTSYLLCELHLGLPALALIQAHSSLSVSPLRHVPAISGLLGMLFPLSGLQFPLPSTKLTLPTPPALGLIGNSLGKTFPPKSNSLLIGSPTNISSSYQQLQKLAILFV